MNPEIEELSVPTAELLEALLASSPPIELRPVSEGDLARYAFGWATEEEEVEVLDALISSGSLRERLMVVRGSLDRPETRSPEVSGFLEHLVDVAAAAYGSLEKGITDWKSSFEQSLVVHAAMREFADRARSKPGGLAFARSGPTLSVEALQEVSISGDADFGRGDVLYVRAERSDEERSMRLDIVDEILGSIPVAFAQPEAGGWRFQVNTVEDWDPEALNAAPFRLRFADEPVSQDSSEFAIHVKGGYLMRLPMLAAPFVRDGEVRLRIEFDAKFREAHADDLLEAQFNAGPCSIPLRTWRVSELPEDGLLVAPIPSSRDGKLSKAAIKLLLRGRRQGTGDRER